MSEYETYGDIEAVMAEIRVEEGSDAEPFRDDYLGLDYDEKDGVLYVTLSYANLVEQRKQEFDLSSPNCRDAIKQWIIESAEELWALIWMGDEEPEYHPNPMDEDD